MDKRPHISQPCSRLAFVERNIGAMPEETTAHNHDGVEESMVLCKLNRNPEQLRGAFSDGVSHR